LRDQLTRLAMISLFRRPPITPRQHTLVDYFQSAALVVAPELLGLRGTTAKLVRAFGVLQAVTNALTDSSASFRRVIPAPRHAAIEKWSGFAVLAAALLTDGLKPGNRGFLIGQALLASTIFNLTDYHGNPDR
jgi:hypothetical protein